MGCWRREAWWARQWARRWGVGALGARATGLPDRGGCQLEACARRSDYAGVCRRVMGDGELGRRGSDEVRQVIFLKTGGQVPVAARAVGRVDDDPANCASRRMLRNDRPGLGPFRVCYTSFAEGDAGVLEGP